MGEAGAEEIAPLRRERTTLFVPRAIRGGYPRRHQIPFLPKGTLCSSDVAKPRVSLVFLTGRMRALPPLNAPRIFEVPARTGSHVGAAAELGLTHGAISRQVAALEGSLGQRLFVRVGRRMVPMSAAEAFAAEVSLSLERLILAADACGRSDAPRVLRVSAPTTFAMRWLIPRRDRFHAARPEAEVIVATATTLQDQLRGGFELAVRREPRLGGVGSCVGELTGPCAFATSQHSRDQSLPSMNPAISRAMSFSRAKRAPAIGPTGSMRQTSRSKRDVDAYSIIFRHHRAV